MLVRRLYDIKGEGVSDAYQSLAVAVLDTTIKDLQESRTKGRGNHKSLVEEIETFLSTKHFEFLCKIASLDVVKTRTLIMGELDK